MRYFLSVGLILFVFSYALATNASGIVTCRCGYAASGSCIPCGETAPQKPGDPVKRTDGAVSCPCGFGAGNNCLPCTNQEDGDKTGRYKRSDNVVSCPCGYGAGNNCKPCGK